MKIQYVYNGFCCLAGMAFGWGLTSLMQGDVKTAVVSVYVCLASWWIKELICNTWGEDIEW